MLWNMAAFAAMLYCIVRAIVDFRQRNYVWAAWGLGSAAFFLLLAISTPPVMVDVPVRVSG